LRRPPRSAHTWARARARARACMSRAGLARAQRKGTVRRHAGVVRARGGVAAGGKGHGTEGGERQPFARLGRERV
jgi:hypothetical protein